MALGSRRKAGYSRPRGPARPKRRYSGCGRVREGDRVRLALRRFSRRGSDFAGARRARVVPGAEQRPDAMAQEAYGDWHFAWLVTAFNRNSAELACPYRMITRSEVYLPKTSDALKTMKGDDVD